MCYNVTFKFRENSNHFHFTLRPKNSLANLFDICRNGLAYDFWCLNRNKFHSTFSHPIKWCCDFSSNKKKSITVIGYCFSSYRFLSSLKCSKIDVNVRCTMPWSFVQKKTHLQRRRHKNMCECRLQRGRQSCCRLESWKSKNAFFVWQEDIDCCCGSLSPCGVRSCDILLSAVCLSDFSAP